MGRIFPLSKIHRNSLFSSLDIDKALLKVLQRYLFLHYLPTYFRLFTSRTTYIFEELLGNISGALPDEGAAPVI